MEGEFRYRGRVITAAEVEIMRQLIAQYPHTNRRQLSLRLCEAWGWKQANGALRDMVCRGLLLELARAGHLELPSATHVHRNPSARRATHGAKALTPLLLDTTPVEGPLRALRPLEFQQVRRTLEEPLFNYLVAEYHPLGYTRPVGEHLKYLVYATGRPIACVAWSSAPRHLGARDRFIGWGAEARRRNLRFLAYNPRYLILPWVRVAHLCSAAASPWPAHKTRLRAGEQGKFCPRIRMAFSMRKKPPRSIFKAPGWLLCRPATQAKARPNQGKAFLGCAADCSRPERRIF